VLGQSTIKNTITYIRSYLSDLASFLPIDEMRDRITELSSWTDHPGQDLEPAYHGRRLRCYAHLAEQGAGLACIRANNLHAYMDLTRQATKVQQVCEIILTFI